MFRNDYRRVLRDITRRFFCALLQNEAPEAAEINVLFLGQVFFHKIHKRFDRDQHRRFVNSRFLRNLRYDFRFCHKLLQ